MKKTKLLITSFLMLTVLFLVPSCSPDNYSLDSIMDQSNVNFEATQDLVTSPGGNVVKLKNLTPAIIPYWSYTDSNGNEIGHTNTNEPSISLPFAGTYNVSLTAFGQGGSATSTKKITVTENDTSLFSDPRWDLLTNGVNGKTWILYMTAPISFSGGSTDYPGWWPNLSDISWAGLEDKNWGEVTFNLDGGFNVSVTQTDGATGSTAQITKKGTFNFKLTDGSTNDRIAFNGGPKMLHPYPESWFSSNLADVQIIQLTETTFVFGATRSSDNQWCWFHLIAK